MSETYIHYGHKHFEKGLFKPITNRRHLTKPNGGFWASNINAKCGWKDWCESEEFRDCNKENSFSFIILDSAKILRVNSMNDISDLPIIAKMSSWICLDFEELSKEYDAIEVNISEDEMLYWNLYGWDCDSILVMNPDVIQEI